MDVGDLPNHVKYCVPVWLAFFEQLSVHHRSAHGGARIPNNWYQSIWFKVVFDFLFKNESCQNYVLTIPLCRGRRDEATGEKGVEIILTRRRGGWPRAQTCATRLLHPDGLTRPEYQLTRPMWLTRIRMMSAWHNCDVSMHSRHAQDDVSLM